VKPVQDGPEVVYRSALFHEVMTRIERVARYDVSVLIEGETGTGKEVLARHLHYSSGRSGGPFVPINAGAIVDLLVENELFGHEGGAYTDARSSRPGLVELANGGTLFLDELDALGAHSQAALLRFLQDGCYRPVGSTRDLVADVRIVAATNAELDILHRSGAIRSDLYFRLAGVTIHVPPLRSRPDDILPLARHFLAELTVRWPQRGQCSLGPEMCSWLLSNYWPGNVRELRSAVEQCFIMGDGDILTPLVEQERPDVPALGCFRAEKAGMVSAFERDYLERAMRQANGNVSQAARAAGKERKGFDRLLRKHGIERQMFVPERS
jgi:two-component system, NtrC family, response regulator GlrR